MHVDAGVPLEEQQRQQRPGRAAARGEAAPSGGAQPAAEHQPPQQHAGAAAAAPPPPAAPEGPDFARRVRPRTRVFCPVPGCPRADPAATAGGADHQSMRLHLNEHAAGRFPGLPLAPQDYLDDHRLSQCSVCQRFLSTRYNGICPRCRPAARAAAAGAAPAVDDAVPRPPGLPSLEE
eukprot:6477400-Pyramimonas_sp.AAC.1